MRVAETGDSWAEVEWDRAVDTAPGEEPVLYEVRGEGFMR